jgi:TIR domain
MAYLPGFENDIFISYSHLNEDADRWVSKFHNRLEAELRPLAGKDLKIWRDPRLNGNQLFDKTINTAIESTGLLLALNSIAYKDSDYCQQELQWFCERAQKDGWGSSIGDRKRICNVLLNNLPFKEWHPAFSGASGYTFHEEVSDSDIALPYRPDSAKFKTSIRKLAVDLALTIRALRQTILNAQLDDAATTQSNINVLAPSGSTILLDTHMKDDDYAIEVRNALRSLNVKAIFNQSEDDPGENVKILEARLTSLRRMIIVFGNVQESWVINRLSMASEIANREKEKASLKLGIYYAPKRQKGNGGQFRIGSLTVCELDDADLRNPQALQPLLG